MKEKIYTIPINESFDQDTECPFCYIEKKLEADAVKYALGPAMMEPDYRIISNDKGYCNKHFSMMFSQPNKLSLALVLETHVAEIIKKLEKHQAVSKLKGSKSSLFGSKKTNTHITSLTEECKDMQSSCVICEKIDAEFKRYTEVFFYMWEKDEELKNKVLKSKGFCMKHFSLLCTTAPKHLKKPEDFISSIYALELDNLKRLNEDVHKFTLKFDYRNKDMELGAAEDAPLRTIEKLRGHILPIKPEN